MKRLILIYLLVVSMAALVPTAKADNPVYWSFHLETYGERNNDGPLSPPIDTGYPQYEYNWVITDAQVMIMDVWYSVPTSLNGSGIWGTIPFTDELIYQHSSPEASFDILASIDSSGYGTISIDNITLGSAMGNPITGLGCDGNITVIPEPATICLLGLGALSLVRRRK